MYFLKRVNLITFQLSFSPTTPGWSHARLLGLLAAIFALSSFMLLLCTAAAFFYLSFNTFVFMAAEVIYYNCGLLNCKMCTMQGKLTIHHNHYPRVYHNLKLYKL